MDMISRKRNRNRPLHFRQAAVLAFKSIYDKRLFGNNRAWQLSAVRTRRPAPCALLVVEHAPGRSVEVLVLPAADGPEEGGEAQPPRKSAIGMR